MEKSKVYFIREIKPENVLKLYEVLDQSLEGNVAVKLHSGEKGNQNYLRPDFVRPIIEHINGTVVECNTAYEGQRNTTEKHMKLIEEHGWNKDFKFELLDAEGPDLEVEIPNGKVINKNYLGKNIKNYDSMLVLSHFKGHPMGGYGGAIKQLSIGCASSSGKAWIHSAGVTADVNGVWRNVAPQEKFLEAMADAALSVTNLFKNKIAYINIMCNMSVDCDCCAVAEDPCMKDIGILASLDPVAIDKACVDLVEKSDDEGKVALLERIKSRKGTHTIDVAESLGMGTKEYELIEIE
ncbi:MAG: DUF362 domain-containing protein [Clostridia bacterium]|nr:DUF362 domain-containing protein [Clostridia bacterium]